ncbi:MAG: fumarate hydratase [Fusobacteria bacterium]|nr:fumarate hydratase [Fusobacteriota bacterium]
MRTVFYDEIVKKIKNEVININCKPSQHLLDLYEKGIHNETDGRSKNILCILKENSLIASEKMIPICQDTGTLVALVYLGKDIKLDKGFLLDAICQGVSEGYKDGYLRKSIVNNPIERINTNNNLPPVVHTFITNDDQLTIIIMAKGAGSENMSSLKMMAPSSGIDGIREFVIDTVRKAGPNPCPPISLGIGIGSNFEGVALLAKQALVKDLISDKLSYHNDYEILENEILDELNNLNIGPQGFGGKTGVFEVKILMEPCHIASLPVAVNINCHVLRHARIEF